MTSGRVSCSRSKLPWYERSASAPSNRKSSSVRPARCSMVPHAPSRIRIRSRAQSLMSVRLTLSPRPAGGGHRPCGGTASGAAAAGSGVPPRWSPGGGGRAPGRPRIRDLAGPSPACPAQATCGTRRGGRRGRMGTVIEAFTADDVRAAEEPLLAAERGFSGGLMHHAATALELTVRRELRRAGEGGPGERVWLGGAGGEAYAGDGGLEGLLGIGGRGGLRGDRTVTCGT